MKDFTQWLFEKRDIDGMVIGMIISRPIGDLMRNISDGFIIPIINGIAQIDKNKKYVVKIGKHNIEFKLNEILYSFIVAFLNILLAYVLVKYIYVYLINQKE